jgi:hypothetical protein
MVHVRGIPAISVCSSATPISVPTTQNKLRCTLHLRRSHPCGSADSFFLLPILSYMFRNIREEQ